MKPLPRLPFCHTHGSAPPAHTCIRHLPVLPRGAVSQALRKGRGVCVSGALALLTATGARPSLRLELGDWPGLGPAFPGCWCGGLGCVHPTARLQQVRRWDEQGPLCPGKAQETPDMWGKAHTYAPLRPAPLPPQRVGRGSNEPDSPGCGMGSGAHRPCPCHPADGWERGPGLGPAGSLQNTGSCWCGHWWVGPGKPRPRHARNGSAGEAIHPASASMTLV